MNITTIEPSFTILNDGNVKCNEFQKEKDAIRDTSIISYLKKIPNGIENTCFDCIHFQTNTCKFGTSYAKTIKEETRKGQNHCELCGRQISKYWANLYYEFVSMKNINVIPLCCTCFAAFKHNTWENAKKSRKNELKHKVHEDLSIFFFFLLLFFYSFLEHDTSYSISSDIPLWLNIIAILATICIDGMLFFYIMPKLWVDIGKFRRSKSSRFIKEKLEYYHIENSGINEPKNQILNKKNKEKNEILSTSEIQIKLDEAGIPNSSRKNIFYFKGIKNIKRCVLFGALSPETAVSPLEFTNKGKYYPKNINELFLFKIIKITPTGNIYLNRKNLFKIPFLFFSAYSTTLILISVILHISFIFPLVLGLLVTFSDIRMFLLWIKIKIKLKKKFKKSDKK
ncbi:MAG: hypothetical protein ACTSXK_17475 [Promethearchaeota archaeon]